MDNQIDTGGPIIPHDGQADYTGGLTLRDYFAGKVMHAEVTTMVDGPAAEAMAEACAESGESVPDHVARISYELADAMMRARKKYYP